MRISILITNLKDATKTFTYQTRTKDEESDKFNILRLDPECNQRTWMEYLETIAAQSRAPQMITLMKVSKQFWKVYFRLNF